MTDRLGWGEMFSSGGPARRLVHFAWAGSTGLLLVLGACAGPEPDLPELRSDQASRLPRERRLSRGGDEPVEAHCTISYVTASGTVETRYAIDADGHPVGAWIAPHAHVIRWERVHDDGGHLAEIWVRQADLRTGGEALRTLWRYSDGRVTSDGGRAYEWREDGLPSRVWETDWTWIPTWDADGRLLAEDRDWYSFPDGDRTEWRWEGDRLLGFVGLDDGVEWRRTDWDAWDGDLPVHGVSTLHSERWEERWEWEDGRPTIHTSTRSGSEEIVGAWTWDGARLLAAEGQGWRASWTWDDADRVVAQELSTTSATRWWTFAWDGDRMVEESETWSDGHWSVRRWAGDCPEAVQPRSTLDVRPRDGDPFPDVASHLPQQEEPWW